MMMMMMMMMKVTLMMSMTMTMMIVMMRMTIMVMIMLTLAGAHPLLQTNCCNFPLELWTPGSRPPSSPWSPDLREYFCCCSC